MIPEDHTDPSTSVCGSYYRRVIDKSINQGDSITFNFDTFENTNPNQKCSLNLYNGERKLADATQKPVPIKRTNDNSFEMNCDDDNKVVIPAGIDYQILTFQWVYKVDNKDEYHYCADIYLKDGVTNQKFYSKEAAQKWLDEVGKNR